MKKNILLLCAALLCLSTSIAQNYKITGTVVDSLGVPLQMANVIAYQQDKNLGAFGITNQEGKYKLEGLKQDSTYTIKVSFLGLKQIEEKVEKLQGDLVKNFMMMAGADELDAINLTYQMPVSIKGDTIVYDADSFTNGTEDKLGDVLQKLPGVEVNDDGDITVEGQVVEKVQVEGKDFFEGDSRLATKNIPADAVSKVQVLKNYNNQSQLKGLGNDQDRYVINIKLKEGKKKFWFGEATVGAGYGGQAERYLIQPKAFYYSEDFSVNILTDFNNLGTPAFTGRDYFRFIGFNRRDTRQNNASINVNAASTFNAFATNRALSIDSKFLAGNASWKVSDKLDMSAFAILSSTD
ncbi:TonB-dependent receptor, partial [Nonlabens ulvanivorans]